MMNAGTMMLPKNATAMSQGEMQCTEGGDGGVIYEIVKLGIKASHYNAHRSYSKYFTRSGKRVKVTYKAISKKSCPLCKIKSY